MTRTAQKLNHKSRWAESVKRCKGSNKAAVALANNARILALARSPSALPTRLTLLNSLMLTV